MSAPNLPPKYDAKYPNVAGTPQEPQYHPQNGTAPPGYPHPGANAYPQPPATGYPSAAYPPQPQPAVYYGTVSPQRPMAFGCGLQAMLFIFGWIFPIFWTIGFFAYLCQSRARRDRREKPFWIANTILTIAYIIGVIVIIVLAATGKINRNSSGQCYSYRYRSYYAC